MASKEDVESLKSAWGVVTAAAVAGPLPLWTSDLQPPWPSGSTVVATTVCATAIWLAFRLKSMGRRQSVPKILGFADLIVGLVLGALYFGARSTTS